MDPDSALIVKLSRSLAGSPGGGVFVGAHSDRATALTFLLPWLSRRYLGSTVSLDKPACYSGRSPR